ncbi:MAG: energy transducer TonB [Thermodesulfobacteriota bacterium]
MRGSIKEAARAEPPPAASTTGLRAESLEIKYKAYFSLIRDHVQRNWIVPESFDNEKVSVIVSIRIGRNGDLIKSWVEKGSGSRQFDDSLLKAVKKASPFPPLPQDFTEDILETGLRFCPRCD